MKELSFEKMEVIKGGGEYDAYICAGGIALVILGAGYNIFAVVEGAILIYEFC